MLRREYQAALPRKLGAIETAAAEADTLSPDKLETLCILAHRLAGSAAIYGQPTLSHAAAELELHVKKIAESPALAGMLRPRLATLLRALRAAVDGCAGSEPSGSAATSRL